MMNRLSRFFTAAVSVLLLTTGSPQFAVAHPLILAKATADFSQPDLYEITIVCDVAALVMQSTPGHLDPDLIDEFRNMPREELMQWIGDARRAFQPRFRIEFDGVQAVPLVVEFPDADNLRKGLADDGATLPKQIHIQGPMSRETRQFSIAFPSDLGQVMLTILRPNLEPGQLALDPGEFSRPVDLHNALPQSKLGVAWEYLVWGFEHILPKGLDHILFVLGLFVLSPRLKPLLWQVTAFTVAHSVTLVLSSYKFVTLPSEVVEPLIALSIAFIAVENIFTAQLSWWRPVIVFAFGLLHGLGFAGVLGELGLPKSDFLMALLMFNVGVELGQLAVILLALLAVGWFRDRPWYRSRIVIPASCAIAIVGLYWTVERAFF
jgi:hydrogenase/urease accessory protein HupE